MRRKGRDYRSLINKAEALSLSEKGFSSPLYDTYNFIYFLFNQSSLPEENEEPVKRKNHFEFLLVSLRGRLTKGFKEIYVNWERIMEKSVNLLLV